MNSRALGSIGVFRGKGNLTLTDGKLTTTFAKGGRLTLQLFRNADTNDRMLKAEGKDSGGFTYVAELKRSGGGASAPMK